MKIVCLSDSAFVREQTDCERSQWVRPLDSLGIVAGVAPQTPKCIDTHNMYCSRQALVHRLDIVRLAGHVEERSLQPTMS